MTFCLARLRILCIDTLLLFRPSREKALFSFLGLLLFLARGATAACLVCVLPAVPLLHVSLDVADEIRDTAVEVLRGVRARVSA